MVNKLNLTSTNIYIYILNIPNFSNFLLGKSTRKFFNLKQKPPNHEEKYLFVLAPSHF